MGEAVDRFGVQLKAGDRVVLLDMPQWLIHDLPEDEQIELLGFVGKHGTVERIEREDLVWVGVGHTEDVDDQAYYSGHSFAIEPANLKRA